MRGLAGIALGIILASPAFAQGGAPPALPSLPDSPPVQVGPGDTTGASPSSGCTPSVAAWHDLLATSKVLVEGLLGGNNPAVGIYFAQAPNNGPWQIWLVKPDGSACPLIEGPQSKTLAGDGMPLDDLQNPSKD